jgi:3'(2'), 5'-bisphosphate nucleotidase
MEELKILKKAIRTAGEEVLKHYRSDLKIDYKEDESPLTQADLSSNAVLKEMLAETGYPILSEEGADDLKRLNSAKVWIIDPLDGTMDFIQETGEFSVMAGLVDQGKPLLGAVFQPATGELFYAEKGKGAFKEDGYRQKKRLQVSSTKEVKEARMVVSRNHLKPEDESLADKLQIKKMKKVGSNGVKIAKIAAGEADFFVNTGSGMGEWDSCAPDIILKEAGGILTDKLGQEIMYNKKEPILKNGLVAGNKLLHKKVAEALNSTEAFAKESD